MPAQGVLLTCSTVGNQREMFLHILNSALHLSLHLNRMGKERHALCAEHHYCWTVELPTEPTSCMRMHTTTPAAIEQKEGVPAPAAPAIFQNGKHVQSIDILKIKIGELNMANYHLHTGSVSNGNG